MQPINELKVKITAQTAADIVEAFEGESPQYLAEYTNFYELMASLSEAEAEAQAMADAVHSRVRTLGERKKRLQARCDKAREVMQYLMGAADQKKVELAECTVSLSAAAPKVVIVDEAALPDAYCRVTRAPDKAKIKEALQSFQDVEGASLSNGGQTLTIRRA